jgi:hypothetical protein
VRITYYLDQPAVGAAVLTISDANGDIVDTFPSAIPTDKQDRLGLYITAHEGMNSFQWPMMYPAGVKMIDTDFHTRPAGPLATPGIYSATLTVGEWSMTQSFSLLKDPRVSTSDAALAEQFELLRRIQDKLSDIATGVNTIRTLKRQTSDWTARLGNTASATSVVHATEELSQRLTAIENELVQVEFTSDGDTLNYREQLFEKLSALPPVVSSADARPTTQSYAVYDKLAGQIDGQLDRLNALVSGDVARLNDLLDDVGVPRLGL